LDGLGGRILWDFERSLTVSTATIRAEIPHALEDLGFTVTNSQFSMVEAVRGNRWAGPIQQDKLPLAVTVWFAEQGVGCSLTGRLEDRWVIPGGPHWARRQYEHLFATTLQSIDARLENVDPTLRPGYPPPRVRLVGEGGIGDGDALAGIKEVRFQGPRGSVTMSAVQASAHLAVGQLMVSHQQVQEIPNLGNEIAHFMVKVEQSLERQHRPAVDIAVTEEECPIFELLYEQASVRATLPVRTLHVCEACRFETLENPDYQRILEQNARLEGWRRFIDIAEDGVSAFELASVVLRSKTVQPTFVCGRCQGMVATSLVVTLCPSCGARQQSAELRTCDSCDHDFREVLEKGDPWWTLPPPPPTELPPLPAPVHDPAPQGGALHTPAGWYTDKMHRHEYRYWDGQSWTEHVTDKGRPGLDSLDP